MSATWHATASVVPEYKCMCATRLQLCALWYFCEWLVADACLPLGMQLQVSPRLQLCGVYRGQGGSCMSVTRHATASVVLDCNLRQGILATCMYTAKPSTACVTIIPQMRAIQQDCNCEFVSYFLTSVFLLIPLFLSTFFYFYPLFSIFNFPFSILLF